MDSGIKTGLWVLLGLVLLYVVFRVLIPIVAWIVNAIFTLAILVAVLFVAYLVVSHLLGNRGNSSTSQERERIFE